MIENNTPKIEDISSDDIQYFMETLESCLPTDFEYTENPVKDTQIWYRMMRYFNGVLESRGDKPYEPKEWHFDSADYE